MLVTKVVNGKDNEVESIRCGPVDSNGRKCGSGARARCLARRRFSFAGHRSRRQSGIALILVIFVVALASIIVVSATYSTHLASRRSSIVAKGVRAEYLLKSAVNVARILLREDKIPEDSAKDLWGKFIDGIPIPGEMIGIDEPNVQVALEIRPEDSKIPLKQLTLGGVNNAWRDILVRLFRNLGFDADNEEDQTGLLPKGTKVDAQKLVALLIDYADPDTTPYSDPGFAEGFEGERDKEIFPNRNFRRVSELATIPGFTAARLQRLTPFVSTEGIRVNINTAPREVLKALSDDIDDSVADQIIAFREGPNGPLVGGSGAGSLSEVVSPQLASDLVALVGTTSTLFQVIAKVDYDTSTYFMRAILKRDVPGELPRLEAVELF